MPFMHLVHGFLFQVAVIPKLCVWHLDSPISCKDGPGCVLFYVPSPIPKEAVAHGLMPLLLLWDEFKIVTGRHLGSDVATESQA